MERSEVLNYLNSTINRVSIDMSDVFMIRNFIHQKRERRMWSIKPYLRKSSLRSSVDKPNPHSGII